jgi:hypothetical protein
LLEGDDAVQTFGQYELRRSVPPAADEKLDTRLYDARGGYRGELRGRETPTLKALGISSWSDFGKEKIALLNAYRPERLPYGRDWVLVLERARPE